MTILQEKELEQMNPLPREIDHDHDLVDELSRRLDAVCRYAENIAHAEGDPEEVHQQIHIRLPYGEHLECVIGCHPFRCK